MNYSVILDSTSLERQLLKKRLSKACRLLNRRGFVEYFEGNISCRLPGGLYFIKRTGATFRDMKPDDLVLMDEKGKSLMGGTPSREKLLHLKVYRKRPDVSFIIHTHPPQLIRYSRSSDDLLKIGGPLEDEHSPKTNEIPIVGPFKAGSVELATAVADALADSACRAVIIREHGLVVVGSRLDEAFDLTLLVEKMIGTI